RPAELAAVVSAMVYESRGDDRAPSQGTDVPTERLRRALAQTRRLWTTLRADEQRHRIDPSPEPDEGFGHAGYLWATTGDLAGSLAASDAEGAASGGRGSPRKLGSHPRAGAYPQSAGDFVRWCRQVIDLLDQLRKAPTDPALQATAKRAIDDIR